MAPHTRKYEMSIKPSRQLLTVKDTADRLAIKEATVRKMIFQRKLPIVRIGRSVRIPIEEVERLMVEGYQPALPHHVLSGVNPILS